MPHIKGFGRIDWNFWFWVDSRFGEEVGHPTSKPTGCIDGGYERTFQWSTGKNRTPVSLVFRPDEPLPKGRFNFVALAEEEEFRYRYTSPCPAKLIRFKALLPLTKSTGHEWIELNRVRDELHVMFFVSGLVHSPEGLMRSIVRRLSHE